ncbi:MAG: hypothetical protein AAFV53_12960 [Myxococcota bacterium]
MLAAALFGGILATTAHAASFDPELTWRTLQTEHFNITFHGGEEQLAEELSIIVEDVYDELTAELAWKPRRRTEVVLVDNTDTANGYAFTVPVNTIVIFVTAPEAGSTLSLYEDWADAIFTHEYTHILHLDTIEGLPRLLRGVMGRIISVNQLSPGWLVEGQATFQETRHTNGGRGRSTYVDMIKRTTILAGEFPPLGNLDGYQTDPPAGNLRYLFGQDFMQYVSDRTGEMVWTDWNHVYGGWIPFLLPSKMVFGERLVPLYYDWRDELTAQVEAQRDAVLAQGATDFTVLSDGDDFCAAPTFSPDGKKLVWSCSDRRTGSAIYLARADGSDAKMELDNQFASDFSWRADSNAFAFSSRRVVNRFNVYSDVVLHTLGGGTVAMTSGDRARDPTLSADGTHLIAVTNKNQNNQLARYTVDRRQEMLTEYTDHTQLSSPQFSPDGRTLAVSVWKGGQQDLWLYDADGAPKRRLTMDLAQDLDPRWSADGRTIYFSSDRTGVFNIYAIDVETEQLWQVTNVVGGAFRPAPSPSETALAFEYYDINGTNIALMDLDREQWTPRGVLPMPLEYRVPLAQALPEPPIPRPAPVPLPSRDEDPSQEETTPRTPKKARSIWADQRPLTEAYHFDGLTGLGGPLDTLARRPGPWGLPGEAGAVGGEFHNDQPTSGPDSIRVDEIEEEERKEQDYPFTSPVGRYNPLPTLLPPRFISPGLFQTAFGFQGTLSTSSSDTLRYYSYSAFVSYRTDSDYVGYGGSFVFNRYVPIFSAGFFTSTVPFGDLFVQNLPPEDGGSWIPSIESANTRYWDRRDRFYVQMTYPTDPFRTVFIRWDGQLRTPWLVPGSSDFGRLGRNDPLPAQVYRPFLPNRGFLSNIAGGWRYARGQFFNKSISPEETRLVSLNGSVSHPWLGSYILDDSDQPQPFSQVLLTAEWREYRTVPWPETWGLFNHVLAFRVAGGASAGDNLRQGNFRLGGSFGDGANTTLPDELRSVRGFPIAVSGGDWYYLGAAEYRFPVVWVERGVGTLPVFFRNISGAVFLDSGYAFDSPLDEDGGTIDPAGTLVGTGAELQGTVFLGWGLGLTVRVGYGFALNGPGYTLGSIDGAYVWLGSSF